MNALPSRKRFSVFICFATVITALFIPSLRSQSDFLVASDSEVRKALSIEKPALQKKQTSFSQDANGSIRIAPVAVTNSAIQAALQLAEADNFFERQEYEFAMLSYKKFLVMSSPNAAGRERALYRLGESERMLGDVRLAESTFHQLILEYPLGFFVASSSFRLGELHDNEGDHLNAVDDFATAAKCTTNPPLHITAVYRQALCLEKINHQAEADLLFEKVAVSNFNSQESNLQIISSLMHLAASATTLGKKEQALLYYQRLLDNPSSSEIFAEASLKAAILDSELGKLSDAKKLLEKVACSKSSGHWNAVAQLTLLRLVAESGDQKRVLDIADEVAGNNPENKAEILLLQAIALRKTGEYAKSLEILDRLIQDFPTSKEASRANFQKLLALYSLKDPYLIAKIDNYLLTAIDPLDRAKAQLLKAEETVCLHNYKEAAKLYHEISRNPLLADSHMEILYKEAWALVQSEDHLAAIVALTHFLESYPNESRSLRVYAQRAVLKQQQKDFSGALADYTIILEKYPSSAESEVALQGKALILGQQQHYQEMADTFALLLNQHPKSAFVAQAHYWIGWVALKNKDYPKAITELQQAKQIAPKQFGERASLCLLTAYYDQGALKDAKCEALSLRPSIISMKIGKWIGIKSMEDGDHATAEHFLKPLTARGMPGAYDPIILRTLAEALIAQGKYEDAQDPAISLLKMAHDPLTRARALLITAIIQLAIKNTPLASSMIDEAMLLEPEGTVNAEARILRGDLLELKKDYAGAAKVYMTVAVLYENSMISSKALRKAVDAYRHAGNYLDAEKALSEFHHRFPVAPISPPPH